MLYYPSEKEDLNFASVAEYEVWVKKSGKWKENAPHIILTGMMGVADSLVSHLEKTGNIVYPVSTVQSLIAGGHADSIHAAAMINMAHGRMGDQVTKWLEKANIPLFATVNANRDYNEWMADEMGMNGGFLSDRKSVVEGKRVDLGGRRIIKKKKTRKSLVQRSKNHSITVHVSDLWYDRMP